MRIKITKGGIYGLPTDENPSGELPVGTILTVKEVPLGWAERVEVLDDEDGKEAVTAKKPSKAE